MLRILTRPCSAISGTYHTSRCRRTPPPRHGSAVGLFSLFALCVLATPRPAIALSLAELVARPQMHRGAGLLCDLLWSDPEADIAGWAENDRGVSYTFGADVVSTAPPPTLPVHLHARFCPYPLFMSLSSPLGPSTRYVSFWDLLFGCHPSVTLPFTSL